MPSELGIQYSSSGLSLNGMSRKSSQEGLSLPHPSNQYTILGHTTTLCLYSQILGLSMYVYGEIVYVCLHLQILGLSMYVYGEIVYVCLHLQILGLSMYVYGER